MKMTDLGATILPGFLRPVAKRVWRSIQRWKVHNISRRISSKELIDGFCTLGIKKNQLISIPDFNWRIQNIGNNPMKILLMKGSFE